MSAKKRPKNSAGRRKVPALESEPTFRRRASWKRSSSSALWLKLNFTVKTARLQSLKRQKYQHLQEEALLKARGLLKNWEDGPVVLTEDLYSRARSDREAQELLNYTPEALALRFSLRSHPAIIGAVKQLWSVELPRDELGCIDQRAYGSLFRRVGRSLEPDATKKRLRRMERTIREDWVRDSKGEPTMSFATFFDSVFELADLWCDTIDVDEYVEFLQRLVLRVTALRDKDGEGRRLLRPLKQIKAIDNDEESSDEEIDTSEVDDEQEFLSGDDDSDSNDDDDDDDEDDNIPVVKLPAAVPTISLGFIASKTLQTFRSKSRPPSAGNPPNGPDSVTEDRPRQASVVMIGDVALCNFREDDTTPKTPTGLRAPSARSRASSAKGRNPMTIVLGGVTNADHDDGVNALMAMHRSAQARTPIVVEDAVPNNVPLKKNASPRQIQARPAKVFTAALGEPKPQSSVANVNMDGLQASGGLRGPLTNSAPHLRTTGEPQSGMLGDVDAARVRSGGAKRSMLASSSPKAKGRNPAGITFDGANQAKSNNKRLESLGMNTSVSTNTLNLSVNSSQDATIKIPAKFMGSLVDQNQSMGVQSNSAQSTEQAHREYVSGMGLVDPTVRTNEIASSHLHHKTDILPVDTSLPFYTFDESASPAKRLLPPVLGDAGHGGGQRGFHNNKGQLGGANASDRQEKLDLADSYKATGYLTGSLHAHLLNPPSRADSRSADGRSMAKSSSRLRLVPSSKDFKAKRRRSRDKLSPERIPDDGTVSPWDAEFDHDHDDDLAKAVPHHQKNHQSEYPKECTTWSSPTPELPANSSQEELGPELVVPTLSVKSSMVPSEPPSCVSEFTTLPQEYHELVLGGSAIHNLKVVTRTASAPISTVSVAYAPVPGKTLPFDPHWMLHGASQPPLSLLETGVEGRTVTNSPSRPILAALASNRPRRERRSTEEDEIGLCSRFAGHLESHGERAITTPSSTFRTDKPETQCACNEFVEGNECDYTDDFDDKRRMQHRCPCPHHGRRSNNWQEEVGNAQHMEENAPAEDMTMIVNATRGLVLRPGTKDRLAARQARYQQQATRSEMMRRRCQYTFAKHLV